MKYVMRRMLLGQHSMDGGMFQCQTYNEAVKVPASDMRWSGGILLHMIGTCSGVEEYVTVHGKTNHKSAKLISRYIAY